MNCPACGTPGAPSQRFCDECGAALGNVPPPAEVATGPVTAPRPQEEAVPVPTRTLPGTPILLSDGEILWRQYQVVLVERFIEPALARLAVTRGLGTVAFEAQEMTVDRHQALAALDGGPVLIPFGQAVEELRIVKDESEIALVARACAITSAACTDALGSVRPGVTEREFAIVLERAMTDRGAEALAFDTIVASGPNGAIPHHVPGNRAFEVGDLITIDCGARYRGYHADMTRTVALGEIAGWQRDIYGLVAAAEQAGITAARAGADVGTVDAAAMDLIADAGHSAHFQHGVGHGVGLEVHEAPIIGYGWTGTLMDRTPVTVEPGIYLPGKGGVRIEDTLVVRAGAGAAGSADLLTTTTRELLVL